MERDEAEALRRTAALAHLALEERELQELVPELARILDAFRALAAFRPAPTQMGTEPAPGRTRADDPEPSLSVECVLSGAPEPHAGFYAVPKTVGGEA
jgi:aspartyl/glutamyl-tRNA(Asn/Gln) amidotransferase C subunit